MTRRTGLFVGVLLCSLFIPAIGMAADPPAAGTSPAIQGKKIAMVIAYHEFEDVEFTVPKTIFEEQGAVVTIVSRALGTARGRNGTAADVHAVLKDLRVAQYDAVVFVGGYGVRDYWTDPVAHAVVRDAANHDTLLAAICWSSVVLANAGVLEGKSGTTFGTFGDAPQQLREKGCRYSDQPVVVDGNIITANGPSASKAFATAIVNALK